MDCPFCKKDRARVIDSRPGETVPTSAGRVCRETWREATEILQKEGMGGAPFRVRTYLCQGCGESWGTVEVEIVTFRDLARL